MNSAVRDANRHVSWRLRRQGADLGRAVRALPGPGSRASSLRPARRVLRSERCGDFARAPNTCGSPCHAASARSATHKDRPQPPAPATVCRSHGYSHRLPVRRRLRRGVVLGE